MVFNGVIYKTSNLINGNWYIGKDEVNNDKYLGSGLLLEKAIKKYGRKNFKKEIIAYANSSEELCLLEKKLIKEYDAVNSHQSYNVADGGNGGNTIAGYDSSQRKGFSEKLSNRWKAYTLERREEILNKMWEGTKGKPKSQDHKQRLSNATKGKKKPQTAASLEKFWSSEESSELRVHLSQVCGRSGEENGFFGKSHTAATKKKLSDTKKGIPNLKKRRFTEEESLKLKEEYNDGTSIGSLALKYNVSKPTISRYLNNTHRCLK